MASSRKSRRQPDYQAYKLVANLAFFALGYYMLNHIATWEEPPLGNTFHIVVGCVLIAATSLMLIRIIKARYFPKKKHKRERPVFLNDIQKQQRDDTPKVP